MIIDLCKPINEGESRTIRITMTVDEARILMPKIRDVDELYSGVRNALIRDVSNTEGRPF